MDRQVSLTAADFKAAQVNFVPLSLRDVPLQTSTVEWADIGGASKARCISNRALTAL